MGLLTRRKFAGLVGMAAASGRLSLGWSQSHGPQQHGAAAEGHPPTPPAAAPPKKAEPKEAAPAGPAAGPAAAPAAAPAPRKPVDRSVAPPEEIWADLMEGNKRFVSGKSNNRDLINARIKTANGQHPWVIVLCCSDSRSGPELIFDQNIGDLFVVRTAGNVADPIALASMEYAVEHLHSRMLVVMGHEKCGAVQATLSGEAMPTTNLTALVTKIKPGIEHLKGLVQGDTLMNLAVEANVHYGSAQIIEASPIVRHEIASGNLTVVKALYRLGTGEVMRLGGNLKEAAETAKH